MRAKFSTTVLSAAFMAGAAQIVAVAEPLGLAENTTPAAKEAPATEVRPVAPPTVDAATSVRETQLIGAKVISRDEKESGEVRRIVDDGGSPKAIVEYGGMLGIGEKRVAIPLADITLISHGKARVSLLKAEIVDLPDYEG